MAKAKVKKTKKSSAKNKGIVAAIVVLAVSIGIAFFVLQSKDDAPPTHTTDLPQETESTGEPKTLGPSQGCNLISTNYVCDIKISNPKQDPLEWSSVITGIDGATISGGGYGNVDPNGSAIVQLNVPKEFCDTNSEGEGSVLILEDKKSSNQAETKFMCNPVATVSPAAY